MSLKTFSLFWYGHTVTEDNQWVDFDEGTGELSAEIPIGEYTPTEYAQAIADAMNAVGTQAYVVALDRATRLLDISAPAPFDFLLATGTHAEQNFGELSGFGSDDLTSEDEYTSSNPTGSVYTPQFILQNHVASDSLQQAADVSKSKSAAGLIEVLKFGTEAFVEFQITFATDLPDMCDGQIIRANPTGYNDLVLLMQYLTTLAPIEFMPDESHPETFQSLVLESTGESSTGTGYKLKELYDVGLPEVFETSTIRMRVI